MFTYRYPLLIYVVNHSQRHLLADTQNYWFIDPISRSHRHQKGGKKIIPFFVKKDTNLHCSQYFSRKKKSAGTEFQQNGILFLRKL